MPPLWQSLLAPVVDHQAADIEKVRRRRTPRLQHLDDAPSFHDEEATRAVAGLPDEERIGEARDDRNKLNRGDERNGDREKSGGNQTRQNVQSFHRRLLRAGTGPKASKSAATRFLQSEARSSGWRIRGAHHRHIVGFALAMYELMTPRPPIVRIMVRQRPLCESVSAPP
jgi:hypothetical protein